MLKKFIVAPGAVFVMPDGEAKLEGAPLELPADLAAIHADKIVPASEDTAAFVAKSKAVPTAE